jgi:hypothetical protein
MSAPKTKSIANGTKKSKVPTTSNSSVPVASVPAKASSGATSSRPDKAAYEAEQQKIKAEIDLLQEKLVCHISFYGLQLHVILKTAQTAVKEKISRVTKGGQGNERRTTLRAELDELRSRQSGNKTSRSKIFDQIKSLQDGIQKKVGTTVPTPVFSPLPCRRIL